MPLPPGKKGLSTRNHITRSLKMLPDARHTPVSAAPCLKGLPPLRTAYYYCLQFALHFYPVKLLHPGLGFS